MVSVRLSDEQIRTQEIGARGDEAGGAVGIGLDRDIAKHLRGVGCE